MQSPPRPAFELEVCVDRVEHAASAAEQGATRIEMNAGLACDGLTPSLASCQWLVENLSIPVMAMLRPHEAGFYYTQLEQELMLRDCEQLLAKGVHGIVAGGLTENGEIDLALTKRLVGLVGPREFVFHRAFDRLSDQLQALEQLVECGVTRVLTSGGADTAINGADRLVSLLQAAEGRIEILPAGGVNSATVGQIVQLGFRQLHGSFRVVRLSSSVDEAGESEPRRAAFLGHPGPNLLDIRATRGYLEQYFQDF